MARDNTNDQIIAQQANVIRPMQFVKMAFSSQTLRLHSGVGEYVMDGETYLGVGALGSISAPTEDITLARNTRTFTLSGLSASGIDIAGLAQTDNYQGRDIWHYLVFLNEDQEIIDGHVYLWRGRMDTISFELGSTATLSLTAESRLADWDRPRVRRYTNQDQQQVYPGDLALEFNSQAAEYEIRWMT
jgi:hypothetical protein